MCEEELIKVLKEMDKKRVEELEPNSRKLFNAIMSIADERDRLLEEKQELISYLKEEIDKYEQSICKILKENDSGWGDIGFYEETRKLSDTYFKMKEILSKIEKE